LQSIKKYYNYLIAIGKRTDHPAQSIQIKDEHSKGYFAAKKLLTAEQLEALWQYALDKKSRYQALKNRNISMLGLLIHQGLTAGEIKRLTPQNIDLQAAKIHVPSSPRLKARQLKLAAPQILPLYQYLDQDRPKLLKSPQTSLFINKLGQPESGETLGYLLKTARPPFKPLQFNPKTVRMSVLASKFKAGWSLLQVQYFAGHRYPSSTQRYQQSDLEALETSLKTYHPLA
jgi:integrase/recombinase XerD